MQAKNAFPKSLILMAVCATFSSTLFAQDEDLATRIKELEAKMQLMQQQRNEQNTQIDLLSEELSSVESKIVESNTALTNTKSKISGSPVYANFKNGVQFHDGTGKWKLKLNGLVQLDARGFNPDETAADTFSLRRVRLGGKATYYDSFTGRVEGEYSKGSSTTLTFAYLEFHKFKQAKVRLGQFRPSYGLERRMRAWLADFGERSLTDSLLGGTWDRGVMGHGAPMPGIYYSTALLNGSNGDDTDATDDGKDAMGRLTVNVAKLADIKDSIIHLGGFYSYGKQEAGSAIPVVQTEGRGYKFFETAGSSKNKFNETVDRTRRGLELAIAKGPVKVQSEYTHANFDGDGFDRDMSAWYASVNWLTTGESFSDFYKDGDFGRLIPHHDFNFGGNGWGALSLGIRYSHFDASDFVATNTTGTGQLAANKTNEADAWTLGANWILNPNTRLVANYVHTSFDTPVTANNKTFDNEDALTMRAQFDF